MSDISGTLAKFCELTNDGSSRFTLSHLELWDTAGLEDYDTLRPLSYHDTDVFVLCFSVDSVSSVKNIESRWMPELKHYYPKCPYESPAAVVAALKASLTNWEFSYLDLGLMIRRRVRSR